MNETGITLGICSNQIVLRAAGTKKPYFKTPENREWVSVVEIVSVEGVSLRCLIIFKGQSLQTTWFSHQVPHWLYTTSENGWIFNQIALNWLQTIFLPETKP